MRRSDLALYVILTGTCLISCRPKYSYGVGFTSCSDGLLSMNVSSSTYSTELPVPLHKGQISADDAITVAIPPEMKLTWSTNSGRSNIATYQIAGRLPGDFDVRRDSLWFMGCTASGH